MYYTKFLFSCCLCPLLSALFLQYLGEKIITNSSESLVIVPAVWQMHCDKLNIVASIPYAAHNKRHLIQVLIVETLNFLINFLKTQNSLDMHLCSLH